MILDGLEHEIGHIRTRDLETEARQVALPHAILPCVGLVRQFGGTRDGPVEAALRKHFLHRGRIRNDAWEEQPAEKVCRRNDRVFKQESDRLDYDASDSGVQHGTRQRDSELLEKVRVSFRYRHPRTES